MRGMWMMDEKCTKIVEACAYCPFMSSMESNTEADWCTAKERELRFNDWAGRGPPKWCPLRSGPWSVKLGKLDD